MPSPAAEVLRDLIRRTALLEAEKVAAVSATQGAIRRAAALSPLKDGELAAIAGCGREHMNRFRNNRAVASIEMLYALAEHFGTEVVTATSQQGQAE